MSKAIINKFCRKFGFEIHGTGYLQAIKKTSFKEDAFEIQADIIEKNATVIFDIGANSGEISLRYHFMFPNSTIYAFEPFPAIFEELKRKIGFKNKIRPIQNAIGLNSGKGIFYVNKNLDTNSLLKPQKTGLSSDRQVANIAKIEVDVISIDEFCEANSINNIDILKMDIQGGELAALQGAKNMLTQKKIKLIYTESYFRKQYVNQPLFQDIATYLAQFGYLLKDIYNPVYGKGCIVWCDAIFILSN